jgi:hypothetical protein
MKSSEEIKIKTIEDISRIGKRIEILNQIYEIFIKHLSRN